MTSRTPVADRSGQVIGRVMAVNTLHRGHGIAKQSRNIIDRNAILQKMTCAAVS